MTDERYRVHRAIRGLLEFLSEEQPLVVVLDDLHWADEASLALLAALLRRPARGPVLLALAFRPAQAPRKLAAALTIPALRRIVLERLSEEQSTLLLGDLDARSAAAIYGQSGGNPFYLQQLARAGGGAHAAAAGHDPSAVGGVPAAVAASLIEELESLQPAERALLNGAAAAGEPFDPDLAAVIAELPENDGLLALDALLALDLVRGTPVPRLFVFRHPLVRQAVYESAPAGWRLAAHARAAAALAERGAPVAERAHHVAAVGPSG